MNRIGRLTRLVEKETGIKCDLRTGRRSYADILVERGASIEDVLLLMGHKTSGTTETYYARKRPEAAMRDARNLFEENSHDPSARNRQPLFKNEVLAMFRSAGVGP